MNEAERFQENEAADAAVKFSQLYYENFDKRRQLVQKLYLENATLLWNGNDVSGAEGIVKYLSALPTSNSLVESVDCHTLPEFPQGLKSMVVTVMGVVKFATRKPEQKPFSQTFMMTAQPTAEGSVSWKIMHDCFRFIE